MSQSRKDLWFNFNKQNDEFSFYIYIYFFEPIKAAMKRIKGMESPPSVLQRCCSASWKVILATVSGFSQLEKSYLYNSNYNSIKWFIWSWSYIAVLLNSHQVLAIFFNRTIITVNLKNRMHKCAFAYIGICIQHQHLKLFPFI